MNLWKKLTISWKKAVILMNKIIFLEKLEKNLKGLPKEEIKDILFDFDYLSKAIYREIVRYLKFNLNIIRVRRSQDDI